MFKRFAALLLFYFAKALNHLNQTIQKKSFKANPINRVNDIDPATIPKFVNQLVKPPAYEPFRLKFKTKTKGRKHGEEPTVIRKKEFSHLYYVDISEFEQQILPDGYPKTTVWGYGGLVRDPQTGKIKYSRSAPGATFEADREIPVMVKWINRLKKPHLFAVDPTLHWANPNNMPMDPSKPWPLFPPGFEEAQKPVPVVTHLHGGEVSSIYDGNPDAWFTYDGKKGSAFVTSFYTYPNKQEPTTLWYHDHALGITRLNVYAGLAGFYLLRDSSKSEACKSDKKRLKLPGGKYEIPIVIQDRSFDSKGNFSFNNVGINPDIHPYWVPEFFGDTIMVNGKVWPNLDVERRQYRFRLLNGSNARFYNLKMSNGMTFIQIGSDGGFLPKPVVLDSLLIAPGERADILVDFSDILPGTSITLTNDANAPYPDGDPPDPFTVGIIMRFRVPENTSAPVKPPVLPERLNNITKLNPDSPQRFLTLNEMMGPNGPVAVLLDDKMWDDPISELPIVGSTEDWVIANLTADTHPIHLHLVQFQVISRQDFDVTGYRSKLDENNEIATLDHKMKLPPIAPYLKGNPIEPPENERGWKDTVRMNPGQITIIRVRFAPQNVPTFISKPGKNLYPFDPTFGPGYVWHCHILDHEDNEMMRPYKVRP